MKDTAVFEPVVSPGQVETVAALAAGLVAFFVVRRNERRKREEFQRRQAQAAQRRSQEKELEKMKIDDL